MAKKKAEEIQQPQQGQLIDLDAAMELAASEINNLPKNQLQKYMPVIEKLKHEGRLSFKEISAFFETKLRLPVKPFDVKTVYEKKYPPKKREKKTDDNAEIPVINEDEKI